MNYMPRPKKAKIITLDDEIKALVPCLNQAKSRFSFHKEERTYGFLALNFGITIKDPILKNKPIVFEDINLFHSQLIVRLKDKYAAKKYIGDRKVEVLEGSSEPQGEMGGNIGIIPSGEGSDTPEAHDSENVSREISRIEKKDEEVKEIDSFTLEERDKETESHFDSIFVPKWPDQKANLLKQKDGCEQLETARKLFNEIWYNLKPGFLLNAQTGAGKTYIVGSVIKNLLNHGLLEKARCISPIPVAYITKTSIVEQTENDVLKEAFNLDVVNTVHVFNIETLRSKFGKLFVKERINVVNGQETIEYEWNPNIVPCLFIWDECQILAREESIQSKIAQAVSRVKNKTIIQIFMSATPFSRVYEARCFAVATHTTFFFGMGEVELTDRNWKQFSHQIAAPSDPMDYCEAAIKRFVEKMDPYILRIKNIRPKHRAFNGVSKIFFRTDEERLEYETAWERYQKEKAKIEEESLRTGEGSYFQLLAQLTIMRKAAEKCRRYHLAEFMHKSWLAGKAPVCVVAFKGTITGAYRILVEDYGWCRDDVSIIWGGSVESMNLKKKVGLKIKNNKAFQEAMKEADIDLQELGFDLENLEVKTEEQIAFEKLHNLLTQDPESREKERIRFQKQKSRGLFLTFKSGGVGLSAHHQYPEAKQRETLLTPVYSEKELVQGLGRCPRITSLTDTYQFMCYYVGTIEEAVAQRVVMKLKNLKHVVKMKEAWEDIFTGKKVQLKQDDEETMDMVDEFEGGNSMLEYVEEK